MTDSDPDRRSVLDAKLKKKREVLFTDEPDIGAIEEAYASLQRELAYTQGVLSVVQEEALAVAKRKMDSLEEFALFQGKIFLTARVFMEALGASDEEMHSIFFGSAPPDSFLVNYANSCVQFAEAALEMGKATEELYRAKQSAAGLEALFEALSSAKDEQEHPDKKDLN